MSPWEKGRQLKSFDGNTYTYNANGIRTSKTVDGIRHDYFLDGAKILSETWGNNKLTTLFDNENGVCGIIYNGTPYYFLKNLQGDIIALINQSGETVAEYSYDAWGVPTVTRDISGCSIATVNPYRYRGHYYDQEIGMYYLQSRYYDPVVGRFVNGDEVAFLMFSNSHLFVYCNNNPINREDKFGYCCTPTLPEAVVKPTVNDFKINFSLSQIKIRLPWLAALILGVVFLAIRIALIRGDIRGIHTLTNYLPITVAMTVTYYVPLTAIAELVSAVCNITSVVMVVSTLIGVATAGITGGLSALLEPVLKLIFVELGKALLSYATPSIYDIVQMISHSVLYQQGCFYCFKLIGGASIQF